MIFPFPPDPPVLAVATPEAVVLFDAGGKEVRRVGIAATRLAWSPDGRTLAILAKDRRLLTLGSEGEPKPLAEEAGEPCWARDGRLLFVQGAKGVFAALPGEAATPLVPVAHSPAPNPDGSRLAFALDGASQGGVWVAQADGSGARRLLKGARIGGVSWSYDGRWIAAVADGHMRLVRANGLAARDLGAVSGETALWSAGAPELLARRGESWSVYDALSEAWTEALLDAVPTPRWTGPHRLLGLRGRTATEVTLGGEAATLSREVAVDAARVEGTYRGASFPNRFRAAPRPARGMTAWRGTVASSDPVDGTLWMTVEAETDGRGRETEFGKPARRRAKVPPGPLSRRLAVLPETEAWVVVSGGRVVDAFLPDAPTAPEPAARPARPLRPTRLLEYDGVCRDRVVVPMVYPIPGRHRLVDTFLADRDGGARRHHGNDLMAPKMTPLLAVFDGVVSFYRTDSPGAQNTLYLRGDNGYSASYLHVNNDTPGTDDGQGSLRYAFPADLQPGDRVRAGQVVAYCGDSGNAESTGPHLHFELHDGEGGGVLDPFFSLKAAPHLPSPRYPNPDPDLKPVKGETRWDGVVTAVDAEKRTMALELTATATAKKGLARVTAPRVVYLSLPIGRTIRYRGAEDLAYPLDAVRPGVRLSAVGGAKGAKMAVRAASMALAGG